MDALLNDSRTRLPPVVIHECIVMLVAVVDGESRRDTGGKGYFLGIFGVWIPLVAPVPNENPQPVQDNPSIYESIRQEANSLKASGNRKGLFLKGLFDFDLDMEAGVKFEHAGSFADSADAIEAYEQAAKCFKVAGDLPRAAQNYSKAISLCHRSNRYVKAAGLSESLAGACGNPDDQIYALQNAIQFYEQVPDRRASQVREQLAMSFAQLQRYSEASQAYLQRSAELSDDPILIHSARKNWLLGLCCKTLHNPSSLTEDTSYPTWFVGSEEHKVFDNWLQYREGTLAEFKTSLDLPRWLLDVPVNESLC